MMTETVYICSGERKIVWSSCTVSTDNREIIPFQKVCENRQICYKHPGCIYSDNHSEEPFNTEDYICNHTMWEDFAKNGKCEDPENHPERFKFFEQKITRDGKEYDGYYWEI